VPCTIACIPLTMMHNKIAAIVWYHIAVLSASIRSDILSGMASKSSQQMFFQKFHQKFLAANTK
jgi:hypothetical protein